MKKINILVITEGLSPTFYIRHFEPFSFLFAQNKINCSFRIDTQVTINDLDNNDIYVFNRTRNNLSKNYFFYAKLKGKSTWYDIDDYILEILSYSNDYISAEQKENVLFFLENCDLISTSTEYLKKLLSIYNQNIFVIKNRINLSKYQAGKKKFIKDEFHIVMSFSDNIPLLKHSRKNFLNALKFILNKYKHVKLHIFSNSSFFPLYNKRIFNYGLLDYSSHKLFLKEFPFNLSLNPIEIVKKDSSLSKFINSKSEIKYIEYAASCIPSIFSNSEVYSQVIKEDCCVFVDNTENDWIKKIELFILNRIDANKLINNALQQIKNEYDLQYISNNYMDAINYLVTKHTAESKSYRTSFNQPEKLIFENELYKNIINSHKLGKIALFIIKFISRHSFIRFFYKSIKKLFK